MSEGTWELPGPLDSCGPDIADLVCEDIQARKQIGIKSYGVPLRAHNGRRPLRDLYAEMLDGIQYFRQEIAEREALAEEMEYMISESAAAIKDPATARETVLFLQGHIFALKAAICMVRGNHPEVIL